ncbi:MAG: DNA uptake protein ComE-like DNA-binding protein, partial [Hyphomicrobiaceae bacterium]
AKKPFASVDELVRVRGIGAATLDGLREKISASQKN